MLPLLWDSCFTKICLQWSWVQSAMILLHLTFIAMPCFRAAIGEDCCFPCCIFSVLLFPPCSLCLCCYTSTSRKDMRNVLNLKPVRCDRFLCAMRNAMASYVSCRQIMYYLRWRISLVLNLLIIDRCRPLAVTAQHIAAFSNVHCVKSTVKWRRREDLRHLL